MKRRLLLAAVTGLVLALPFAGARADDRVDLERTSVLVGEHIEMRIQVLAPEGATVELTPGTPGWEGVELVSVDEVTQAPQADGVQWFIVAKIAARCPLGQQAPDVGQVCRRLEASKGEMRTRRCTPASPLR